MPSIADTVLQTGGNTASTPQLLTELNKAKLAQQRGDPAALKEAYRNILIELENQSLKDRMAQGKALSKAEQDLADKQGELDTLTGRGNTITDIVQSTDPNVTSDMRNPAFLQALSEKPESAYTALARLQGDRLTAGTKGRELDQSQQAFDRTGDMIGGVQALEDWTPEQKALMSADINAGTTGLWKAFHDVQENSIDWVMTQAEAAQKLVDMELLSPERGDAFIDNLFHVTSKTKSPLIQLREQLKKDCAEGFLSKEDCDFALKVLYGINDPVTGSGILQRRNMLDQDLEDEIITPEQHKRGVLVIHELVKGTTSSPDKFAVMLDLWKKYQPGTPSSKVVNGLTRGLTNPEQVSTVIARISRWIGDSQTPMELSADKRREAAAAIRLEIQAKPDLGEATLKLSNADLAVGRLLPRIWEIFKEVPEDKWGVISREANRIIWSLGEQTDPRLTKFHTYMTQVADLALRIQTGAALRDEEIVRKEMSLPSIGRKIPFNRSVFEGIASYVLDREGLYYQGIIGDAWSAEIINEHLGALQELEAELEAGNASADNDTIRKESGSKHGLITETEAAKRRGKNNGNQ